MSLVLIHSLALNLFSRSVRVRSPLRCPFHHAETRRAQRAQHHQDCNLDAQATVGRVEETSRSPDALGEFEECKGGSGLAAEYSA